MIRNAKISDAKSIAHIRVDGWKTAYKTLIPDSFLDTLDYEIEEKKLLDILSGVNTEFTSNVLVYETNNEILAFAYYGKALDKDASQYQGEVVALYVAPDKKGNGIGTQIMNYIKNELKKQGFTSMLVWCLKGNEPSLKFYEHLGGSIIGERDFEIDGVNVSEIGILYELS